MTLIYTHDWYANYMGEPQWGWTKQIAGEFKSVEVPGVPCDMFLEPHVAVLAEKFKEAIEDAQAVR